MTESFRISTVIAATPLQIYEAWIDADKHSAMTGSEASVEARPGGRFTAWGPYISGTIVELDPERRIVQDWRTNEFPADAPDSRLEVMLSPEAGGTRVTLVHSGVPEGQGDAYRRGWEEFYFQPMKRYFARNAETERPPASGPGQDGAPGEEMHARPPTEPHPTIVSARPTTEREAARRGPTKRAATKAAARPGTAKKPVSGKAKKKTGSKRAVATKAGKKPVAKKPAARKPAKTQAAKKSGAKTAAARGAKRPAKTARRGPKARGSRRR